MHHQEHEAGHHGLANSGPIKHSKDCTFVLRKKKSKTCLYPNKCIIIAKKSVSSEDWKNLSSNKNTDSVHLNTFKGRGGLS